MADTSYSIRAYYSKFGSRPQGLENSTEVESWEEAKDIVHEWVSSGSYVELENEESGGVCLFEYDTYFADFEGEFPIEESDLTENTYQTLDEILQSKEEIERC